MDHIQESTKSSEQLGEQSSALVDISVLWRRKWSILSCLILTTGLGALYLSQAQLVYESEMRVVVQRNPIGMNEKTLEDDYFLTTQAEVIWSPVTVRAAIRDVPGAVENETEAEAVARTLIAMHVTPLDETNVLKIGLRDTNAVRGHRLVQAIVAAYANHVRNAEAGRRTEDARILTEQEKQISTELEQLRKQFREQREMNPLVGHGADALTIQFGSLKDIGAKLAESRKLRMEAENIQRVTQRGGEFKPNEGVADFAPLHVSQVETLRKESPDSAIAMQPGELLTAFIVPEKLALPMNSDPIAATETGAAVVMTGNPQTITENLMNAQSEATRLASHFGPQHPALSGIHKQVEWWNKCLEASKREAAVVANQQVEVMRATEESLGQLYAAELRTAKELDAHLMAEQEIQGRIDRLQERHQETLTQLNAARMTEQALKQGDSPVEVRILEGDEFILSKVWPKPIQFLAVCAVIGLMGGCILISLAEQFRLRSAVGSGASRPATEPAAA